VGLNISFRESFRENMCKIGATRAAASNKQLFCINYNYFRENVREKENNKVIFAKIS
jgi:hypothetical protein